MEHRNDCRYYKKGILSQGRILIATFCFLALAAFAVFATRAEAVPGYLSSFTNTYPNTTSTALNSCILCHQTASGSPSSPRNSYGNAYSSNGHSFTAIQNLDSDGDGASNITEINAGFFPGNASSTPPSANRAPVAVNDSYSVDAGATLTVSAPGVLGNDTDQDNNPLTAVLASGPSSGAFNLSSNGSFTYTPTIGSGQVTFTYRANDGTVNSNNTATVTITVNAVTPANRAPVAVNDSYSVDAGATLGVIAPGVLGNDTDPDNDPLTAVLASGPSSGAFNLSSNGSFTYTPTISSGQVTFTYRANDGTVNSNNTATVTITVNAVTAANRAPVLSSIGNKTGTVGSPVTFTASATDPDSGQTLTFSLGAGAPAGASINPTSGAFTWTPTSVGSPSVTVRVTDNGTPAMSDQEAITVTVTAGTPGNTAPVADDKAVSTNEGTPVAVTLTASDADGNSLTYAVVAGPSNGTLSGTAPDLTYTPAAGYSGPDSFTYNANDGTDSSNTATVSITVTADTEPPPPPATGDLSVSPADGEAEIPVTTTVMITANASAARSIAEPLDIATIVNNDTFRLTENSSGEEASRSREGDGENTPCVSNGVVNGTIAYDDFRTTATFTPDCLLANGTMYTGTITPVASTQSVLAETFTWSFTTIGQTPDSDDDGVEDGEDDEPEDDKDATPPKSKGKGKFRYRLRNHERAYLRKVRGISDTHYSINQTGKPVGYDFPDGLVDAEIHDVAPGETVEVELEYPEAIPEGSKVYMTDSRGFYEAPAVISGNRVTLTVTDGGIGDSDGQANGVIVDPVGVAVPTATSGGSVDMSTDAAGGGGCSVVGAGGGWKEAAGSYGLLFLVWLGLALRRRNPETGK